MIAPRGPRPVRLGIVVALLLSVALAVRVGYVLGTRDYVARGDAGSYDAIAISLAAGQGWPYKEFGWAYRPPGYPFVLGGIYDLVGLPHGSDRTAARVTQAVVGTVTVGLIGLLAGELWGETAMLLAMGVAAIYLPLVVVGDALVTESLFTPLIVAATVCAIRSRRAVHRYRWALAAGMFAGLASLTRTNGIVVGLALAVVVWNRKAGLRWRSPLASLLVVLAMAVMVSPWTIRNALELHDFVPVSVESGPTLAGTYNDLSRAHDWLWFAGGYHNYRSIVSKHLTGPELDRQLTVAVLGYVAEHPMYGPQVMFWNTVRLLDLYSRRRSHITAKTDVDASPSVADAMIYSFWIAAALALVGSISHAALRAPWCVWLIPAALWLSVALTTTGTPRFRSALEPFVIVLTTLGLIDAGRRLPARLRPAAHRGKALREETPAAQHP